MTNRAASHGLPQLGRRRLVALLAMATPLSVVGCAGLVQPSAREVQIEASLSPDAPMLFYVAAPDCPYCTQWERLTEPAFQVSAARRRLRFVRLEALNIRSSLADGTWPDADRWVRDDFHRHYPGAWGTPLFALVQREQFIVGALGTVRWQSVMMPAILKATETA